MGSSPAKRAICLPRAISSAGQSVGFTHRRPEVRALHRPPGNEIALPMALRCWVAIMLNLLLARQATIQCEAANILDAFLFHGDPRPLLVLREAASY